MENVESDMSLDASEFQSKFGIVKPSLDSSELVFHCQIGRRELLPQRKPEAWASRSKTLGIMNA